MEIIETKRLILRPSTADEFESNYRILVEEIEGAAFTREAYASEFQFDLYLAQQNLGRQFGRPSIVLNDSQRYIGYCSLMPRLCTPEELSFSTTAVPMLVRLSSLETEIGWAIAERYRNNGYATEAARALIDYGFHKLHLPRIIAFTNRGNRTSVRVMEKMSMALSYHPQTDGVVGVLENQGRALEFQSTTSKSIAVRSRSSWRGGLKGTGQRMAPF